MNPIRHRPLILLAESAAPPVAEMIQLEAELRVEAAAGDGKLPTFEMIAYTGGAMSPSGFYGPVVVDLTGVKARAEKLPILRDHDRGRVLGHSESIAVGKDRITVRGVLSGPAAEVAPVIEASRNGFPWGTSIGATISRVERVEAGQKVTVNGRTFDGPVYVAREVEVYEVTVLAVAADPQTGVKIAATALPTGGGAADAIKAERARIAEIRQLVASADLDVEHRERVQELEAAAIDGQITAVQLGRELLELTRGSGPSQQLRRLKAARPTAQPWTRGDDAGRVTTDVLAAATLMLAGFAGLAEKAYGAETTQRAAELRARHLADVLEAGLTMDGVAIPRDRNEMIHAAFSSMSLPVALGGAMDKSLSDAFEEEKPTWISLAREVPVRSFREHTVLRPYLTRKLTQVGPDGELKYMSIGETTDTVKADTFGANIGITRQDVVNDDLQIFADVPRAMGIAARRAMSDEAYTLLLANPGSFFDAGNGNYISGATSVLSIDSLTLALTELRTQTDENGRPLNLSPGALLVPPELEATARALLNSTELGAAAGSPTGNPHKGLVEVLEVEARLSNSTFTGYSAVAWYLWARRQVGALLVAYLNGQRTPTIETFGIDSDPSRLGFTWRIYHDFGFALGEHRGAVKSKGEA